METDSGRAERIDAFLKAAGLQEARRTALTGDASTRRYARLERPGSAPLILMDAPPAAEAPPAGVDADEAARRAAGYNALARLSACRVDAFVAVADWLRGQGLSAPEVVAYDAQAGLAVLEDLGEDLFARRIEAGEPAAPLYAAAIDVLLHLHSKPAPEIAPLPDGGGWAILTYDAVALKTGADLFLQWWPQYAGRPPFSAEAKAQWAALWRPIQARGEEGATAFAHRDYHAENLLWLEARAGLARVGLLDFQDAVRAHPAWDLLSLLQDARRDVGEGLEADMLARYLAGRPGLSPEAFRSDYAGLAALNNARITGLFARLVVRDGKARYRGFMPRMAQLLARNLAHPDLQGLARWFQRHAPVETLA